MLEENNSDVGCSRVTLVEYKAMPGRVVFTTQRLDTPVYCLNQE